jgi:4-hydroxybenzoate polyprenyltransferase
MFKKFFIFLEMIKFEHTLFALPLAFSGVLIAQKTFAPIHVWFWVSMCMVTLRMAAMALNRVIDRVIDAQNPRTQNRALCQGKLSVSFVIIIALVCCAAFVFSAAQLNLLCFQWSWIPLILITLYPYMKRWTFFCHAVLGATLACAPIGGWLAVTGKVHPAMVVFFAAIFFWVMGFDIIYALQDASFDRQAGLHSLPAQLGEKNSLFLSQFFHLLTVIFLVALGFKLSLSWVYFGGLVLVAVFLIREQFLAFSLQEGKIQQAFFVMNAGVSLTLLVTILVTQQFL